MATLSFRCNVMKRKSMNKIHVKLLRSQILVYHKAMRFSALYLAGMSNSWFPFDGSGSFPKTIVCREEATYFPHCSWTKHEYNFTHINMSHVRSPQAQFRSNPSIQEKSRATHNICLKEPAPSHREKHIHILWCITHRWTSKVKTKWEYPLVRKWQRKKHLQRDCSRVTVSFQCHTYFWKRQFLSRTLRKMEGPDSSSQRDLCRKNRKDIVGWGREQEEMWLPASSRLWPAVPPSPVMSSSGAWWMQTFVIVPSSLWGLTLQGGPMEMQKTLGLLLWRWSLLSWGW